jgi:FkbM family methyltransferase
VSFEPQAASFRQLEAEVADDPRSQCLRPLGDTNEVKSVSGAANASSSSLLPMTARHRQGAPESAYASAETVEVCRLDDIAAEFLEPGDRVYLKLDVQGFEAQVIAGAPNVLASTSIVEAEVTLTELYAGQTLTPDLVGLMRERGLVPLQVAPELRDPATGELLQLNMWFGRAAP